MGFNNSKKRKKALQHLSDTAKNKNCTIEKNEFWNLAAIGIDQSNKMLFFSRKKDGAAIYKTIDLTQIQKCNLVRTESTNRAIDKLELQLEFFDKNKPNVSLEFYDKDQSMSLVNEIEISVKWHKIINQTL
jgi:hypothetical protein